MLCLCMLLANNSDLLLCYRPTPPDNNLQQQPENSWANPDILKEASIIKDIPQGSI